MIRFSASLVVVAVGLLVAGLVTSDLKLVYAAIGVSGVALLALIAGAAFKRDELFGATAQPSVQPIEQPQSFDRQRAAASAAVPVSAARSPVGSSPVGQGAVGQAAVGQAAVGQAAGTSLTKGGGSGWGEDGRSAERWSAPDVSRSPSPWPAAPSNGTPVTPATSGSGWVGGGWTATSWDQDPDAERWDTAASATATPEVGGFETAPQPPAPDEGLQPPAPDERPETAAQDGADPEAADAAVTDPEAADTAVTDTAVTDTGVTDSTAAAGSEVATAAFADVTASKTAVDGSAESGTADASEATANAGPAEDGGAPDDGTPAESEPDPSRIVTVAPGVPRYHDAGCILIRFMGDDGLERMSLAAAQEVGCTPCRACLPDALPM